MLASEKLFPIHEECKVTHYNAFGMEAKLHNGDKDEEDDARPTKDQIGRIKEMIKTLKTIEDLIRRLKVNVVYLSMKGLEERITGCGLVIARRVHDLMRKQGSFSKSVMIDESDYERRTQPLVMATYCVRMWEIKAGP